MREPGSPAVLLDSNVWREGFVFGRLWCSFDNGCLEWHLTPQQGNSCSYLENTIKPATSLPASGKDLALPTCLLFLSLALISSHGSFYECCTLTYMLFN